MSVISRRRFLKRTGVAAAAAGWAPGLWTPARAQQLSWLQGVAASTAGTTLEATVVVASTDASGYVRLGSGPGWPTVVREELAAAQSGREGRRVDLATFGHLTDIHLIDAQSPGRVEFTDRLGPPVESAWRAQETMSTQVASAMIERMNSLPGGPMVGRPLDCVVSTGDSIDNQQHNELEWFFTLLNGGSLVPNSGDLARYEGVQDDDFLSYDPYYWHPDVPPTQGITKPADAMKTVYGFPELPGLLDDVITPFSTPGLKVSWFSTYGNHDGLVQGNVNGVNAGLRNFDPIFTGPIKPTNFSAVPTSAASLQALLSNPAALVGLPARTVTADPNRRVVSSAEWIQAHLDSPKGPHGFTPEHLTTVNLDYTFPVAPGVLGISMDTVNHGGYADGSLGQSQLNWLTSQLRAASDHLVIMFSHHNLGTIENTIPDPEDLADPRMGRDALLAVVRQFPNFIAWVNGHTHVNRVNPVPDPTGSTGGFWEITTAAHIDFPEQARVVEVVDNRDGTLSIFATVLEHAGSPVVDLDDRSVLGLASLSRELSANDPQTVRADKLGAPTDLNVELLLGNPIPRVGQGATTTTTPTRSPSGESLARTGGPGKGLLLGTAAAGAALALRNRLRPGAKAEQLR